MTTKRKGKASGDKRKEEDRICGGRGKEIKRDEGKAEIKYDDKIRRGRKTGRKRGEEMRKEESGKKR